MAKLILRAGKVAIKIVLLFAILGLIFFSIKKLPHATAQTEPVQSEFDEQIGLIEAYREQGRYDEAEQMCQDIITQFPGSDGAFEAQIQLVFLYITWDKAAQADAVLNQVINDFADHPDLTSSLVDVSGVYIELKKYDEVISLSEYILNNQPESSELIWAQTNLVQS
ncbi:MAG TPA: tetratricopeptide repeat protein, partial [Planctomycetes bacterium]|nr:tetratricopeptide repeat protein [Planctomycetota bacterium]